MSFVILDRDGVINYNSAEYIRTPDEWRPIPGSLEAIAALNRAGYRVLIATNQSGVARGYYDLEMLDSMHEKMQHLLASVGGYVDEIFFCPHHPEERCACRKPNIGLFQKMQEKYDIDFSKTYFVGDSITDMQAAAAIGCLPIFVLSGRDRLTVDQYPEWRSIPQFQNLAAAVSFILAEKNQVHHG